MHMRPSGTRAQLPEGGSCCAAAGRTAQSAPHFSHFHLLRAALFCAVELQENSRDPLRLCVAPTSQPAMCSPCAGIFYIAATCPCDVARLQSTLSTTTSATCSPPSTQPIRSAHASAQASSSTSVRASIQGFLQLFYLLSSSLCDQPSPCKLCLLLIVALSTCRTSLCI